jgi:hypothetical protein
LREQCAISGLDVYLRCWKLVAKRNHGGIYTNLAYHFHYSCYIFGEVLFLKPGMPITRTCTLVAHETETRSPPTLVGVGPRASTHGTIVFEHKIFGLANELHFHLHTYRLTMNKILPQIASSNYFNWSNLPHNNEICNSYMLLRVIYMWHL